MRRKILHNDSLGVWICSAIAAAFLFVLMVLLVGVCQAHIADRPDLEHWARTLTSRHGYPCCGGQDAFAVEEWDIKDEHFRILVDGEWIVVPDASVVEQPNKYGQALAWLYKDSVGHTQVRCFLPGAGL